MVRRAYVVTKEDHALYARQVRDIIKARAQQVVRQVGDLHGVNLPAIEFVVEAQQVGSQTPAAVIRAQFSGNQFIRLLLVQSRVDDRVLRDSFSKNDLLVIIEDSPAAEFVQVGAGPSLASCRIKAAAPLRLARLIEDLIIDVTIGSYFRGREPIASLVAQEGVASLFSRKVKFARRRSTSTLSMSKGAAYVMFSSLSEAEDNDFERRARDAYAVWAAFAQSLSLRGLAETFAKATVGIPASAEAAFAEVKIFGRQISRRRLQRALGGVTPGDWVALVLRSSSQIRKSPEFRDQVASIFGEDARMNEIRVYNELYYASNKEIIRNIVDAGHVALVRFTVDGGAG